MNQEQNYPIGVPGEAWGEPERAEWLALQRIRRSYQDEVLAKLEPLKQGFDIEQYGALSYDSERYPLFAVRTRQWDAGRPMALVTGGVHGYETSGVQGALRFLETQAQRYAAHFNVLVMPCISPWGYETINRWNPNAVDPNRSFVPNSFSEEAAAVMQCLASLGTTTAVHIDLHETTDTDNSEFRPALAARDNVKDEYSDIPDGFYLVGDDERPVPEFQKAIIASVREVTHIALPDDKGRLIGVPLAQDGVINYATKKLGLCAGVSDCTYATTTEVYPDSPRADDENCNGAQVAAIVGGLDFVIRAIDSPR
jgi:hypothetical protein